MKRRKSLKQREKIAIILIYAIGAGNLNQITDKAAPINEK